MLCHLLVFNEALSLTEIAVRSAIIWLLLSFVIKSLQVDGKATNAKSGLSLACLLSAAIIVTASKLFSNPFGILITGVGVLLLLIALALACIALVELLRDTKHNLKGMKRACFTIIISIILSLIVGFNMEKEVAEESGKKSKTIKLSKDDIEIDIDLIKKILRKEVDRRYEEAGVLKFDEYNFMFATPKKRWTKYPDFLGHEDACFTLSKTFSSMFMMAICETMRAEIGMSYEDFKTYVLANNTVDVQKNELLDEKPWTLNDFEGRMLTRTATVDGEDFYFKHWLGIRNGYYYQLIVFGDYQSAEKIDAEAAVMLQGFRQIDPDRVYVCPLSGPESNLLSEKFSYSVKAEGTFWKKWNDIEEDTGFGEMGLTFDLGYFMITPVCLLGLHPDMDALTEAFLMTLDYPIDTVKEIDRHSDGDIRSRDYERNEDLEGIDFRFRMRIIRTEGYAYLLTGWVMENHKEQVLLVDEIFDRFEPMETTAITNLDTLDRRQKETHALIFDQIGMYYFENEEYRKAITYFKLAVGFDPTQSVYLTNALHAYGRTGDFEPAYQLLQPNIENFEDDQAILSWKAYLLYMLDDNEPALKIYESLFANGYRSDEDFGYYCALMRMFKRYEAGLNAINAYFKDNDTPEATCHRSRIFYDQGRHDEAVTMLKNAMADVEFNLGLAYELDNHYYEMGLYNESIALCDLMIDNDKKNPWGYYRKGKAEYQLNWYSQAKDSVEKAKKLKPDDADISSFLDYISGMLGEGDNYLVKKKIDPVVIPEEYIPEPGNADENTTGYSAEYIARIVGVHFDKEGEYRRTSHSLMKIWNSSAIERFSSFPISFDPLWERIYVNELNVFDNEGRLVSQGDINSYYVLDDTSSGMATHDKTLNLPVPALKAGYYIRLVYTRKTLSKQKSFPLYKHCCSTAYPVKKCIFYFKGDKSRIRWKMPEDVRIKESENEITWFVDEPIVYHQEPFERVYDQFLPMLRVADSKATWEGLATYYLDSIEKTLELTPDIKSLAESLTSGCKEDIEKVSVLSKYVQDEITYNAIEFGWRGTIPHPPSKTHQDKYGDCKDHSLLLHKLLEGVGIRSCLALVHSGLIVCESLPSLDFFNHMIVYVPEINGGQFIDCSDKYFYTLAPVPYGLNGNTALILDRENPRLAKLPDYPADSNRISSERSLTINNDLTISVKEKLIFYGYYRAFMRSFLAHQESRHRKEAILERMKLSGLSIELTNLNIDHVDEVNEPLTLHLEYEVTDCIQSIASMVSGKLPCPWEKFNLEVQHVDDRANPFVIHFPIEFTASIHLTYPENWELTEIFHEGYDESTDFGSCKVTTRKGENDLHIDYTLNRFVGEYEATRYGEFRMSSDWIIKVAENNLLFTDKGKK